MSSISAASAALGDISMYGKRSISAKPDGGQKWKAFGYEKSGRKTQQ